MRKIKYTLLVEGYIEEYFIPLMLNKIGLSSNIQFVKNNGKLSANVKGCGNILNSIEDYATKAVIEESNIFIFGKDLDKSDPSNKEYELIEKDLLKAIPKQIKSLDFIPFIPIQTFDYWMLYHQKAATAHSLEKNDRKKIANELFGSKKKERTHCKNIAEEIIKTIDFDKLSKQSKSFERFYTKILSVIKKK